MDYDVLIADPLPSYDGLTVTIGCPGSGKSTWADKHLPPTTLRLERDRFRECIWGSRRAYHDSPLSHEQRSHVIVEAMGAAMINWPHSSWAVTDTSLLYRNIEPFIEFAERIGVPTRLVVFERSESYLQCVNKVRPKAHRIPEEILDDNIGLFFAANAWWRHTDIETHYAYQTPNAA